MKVAFGDLLEFAVGGGWGEEQPSEGMVAVRIIRGADFPAAESRDIASAPLRYEPSKKVASRTLREGDIVLEVSGGTIDRPTGRSIFVSSQLLSSVDDDVIPASFCRLVRVDRSKAAPAFVYYALRDLYHRGGTWEYQNQSTGISNFQFEMFRERWRLDVPSLSDQQAIAEVLGALDDKIAANTALAAAADALLATMFRVRLHQTEAHDKELAAIANVVLGGTPSRARPDYWADGTIPWLNSGAVNATRIIEPSELITQVALANSAAKLMPSGATLLAITGATLGQIARLEISASGNQSIVGVWSDDVELNTWLYFAVQARLGWLLARTTGAAQQHVSKGDVEQLAVPVPSQAVLMEFSSVAAPLLELAAAAERESLTLAATRDALLPQLMSGKLRVRDAEAAASEAGA